MSFFLNEDQEGLLNEFLDRENRKVCEEQLNSDEIPEEFKDLIKKTIETDSPLPFFNPDHGYYTVSFTPCSKGNRIYVHHHISEVSEAIYDPSLVKVNIEDANELIEEEFEEEVIQKSEEELITESVQNYENVNQTPVGNVNDDGIAFPPGQSIN